MLRSIAAACVLLSMTAPLIAAQTICEDSADDISFFGIAGVDRDVDGQGKAVCFGNLGVNADDGAQSPPGGFVFTERVSFCNQQSCTLITRAAAGGYVLTTGGWCILGGFCPQAGVVLDVWPVVGAGTTKIYINT